MLQYWYKNYPITARNETTDLPEYLPENIYLPLDVVLTQRVQQDFLRETGLSEKISELLSPLRVKAESELIQAIKEIHVLIFNTPFPEKLESALNEAWAYLAPAEQGLFLESQIADENLRPYLYPAWEEQLPAPIRPESLEQAVIRALVAFYHPQSVIYRFRAGLPHDAGGLILRLYQRFPKHFPLGEVYSAHPTTGYQNSYWIEVKGQTYEMSKEALRKSKIACVDRDLGKLSNYILSLEHLNALSELAMSLEKRFSEPFKIEWYLTLNEKKNGHKIWLKSVEPFQAPEPPAQEALPHLPFIPLLSCSDPKQAHHIAHLPHEGIGLCRLEHIIKNQINIHPEAFLAYPKLPTYLKKQIESIAITESKFEHPISFYARELSLAMARLAMAIYPRRILVRFSDFKSSEYLKLTGGNLFEEAEANPLLGVRGASRYLTKQFYLNWHAESSAIAYAREEMGWDNIDILVPFVRTLHEAKLLSEALHKQGLERGKNGLRIFMMCEIPSNALLAEQFLALFDGFSIGSGDLTQLTLGIDTETNEYIHPIDSETDLACKVLYSLAIQAGKKLNKPVGICGQEVSVNLDFARWLIGQGIDSIAFSPEALLEKIQELSATKLK